MIIKIGENGIVVDDDPEVNPLVRLKNDYVNALRLGYSVGLHYFYFDKFNEVELRYLALIKESDLLKLILSGEKIIPMKTIITHRAHKLLTTIKPYKEKRNLIDFLPVSMSDSEYMIQNFSLMHESCTVQQIIKNWRVII